MKRLLIIVLLFNTVVARTQSAEEKLTATLKKFHSALVNKDAVFLNSQADHALSYGHSNGWVETKTDMIKHIETGFLNYHSYKEDSLQVFINGKVANTRFIADINVTMNGKQGNYHLKVLEVWVKKGRRWKLFARQAVK